jgi:hypothetical protein
MHCPRCDFSVGDDQIECPACGIVFARYEAAQQAAAEYEEQCAEEEWDEELESVHIAEALELMTPPRPLRWVAGLNTVGGVLNLLMAVFLFYLASQESAILLPALINAVTGALHIWLGWAVRRLLAPARIFLIVGAFFGLLAVPIGTLLSILLLVYMFHPGMRVLFSGKTVDRLSAEDVDALHGVHASRTGVWFVRVTVCMFVLAGIGILAAVGFGMASGFRAGLEEARAESELKSIDFAVRDYAVGRNLYPPSQRIPQLARTMQAPLPATDPWGHDYRYERQAAKAFRVGSPGPDGEWKHRHLGHYEKGGDLGDDLIVERGKLLR